MTSPVEFLTAAHKQAEEIARWSVIDGEWRVVDTHYGPEVHIGDGDNKWSREGQGVNAAYSCDDPYDDCADARGMYLAEARLIAEHADPAAVLRRITAERSLLADLLAEEHQACEDSWYNCVAADQTGVRDCELPCDCGRDERVERRVRALAEAWGWTEEQHG